MPCALYQVAVTLAETATHIGSLAAATMRLSDELSAIAEQNLRPAELDRAIGEALESGDPVPHRAPAVPECACSQHPGQACPATEGTTE